MICNFFSLTVCSFSLPLHRSTASWSQGRKRDADGKHRNTHEPSGPTLDYDSYSLPDGRSERWVYRNIPSLLSTAKFYLRQRWA